MPIQTYIAFAAFVGAFTLFGVALAWAHWYTRGTRQTFPKF